MNHELIDDAVEFEPRQQVKTFGMPKLRLQGRFCPQVVENGKVIRDYGFQKNLILDNGMNNIATSEICELFEKCISGTGTTAQKVDSGSTTISKTGTTVTSSASFFASGDVGKLLKWDTGEEHRITSYTNATTVEVAASGTIASAQFTMWNVALTALAAVHADHSAYLTGTGNCETTRIGATLTHRRTYDFPAEAGSVTINELGVSEDTGGSNLFSRVLLSVGVALTSGQQLRVIYELDVTVSPTTPTANTPSASGWPVAPASTVDGDEQWQCLQLSAVSDSTGATTTAGAELSGAGGIGAAMEPFTTTSGSTGSYCFISPSATAHNTFPGNGPARGTNASIKQLNHDSYSAGSFSRTKSATFAVGEANRTDFRSVGVGRYNSGSGDDPFDADNQGLVFIFSEAQTKENTHTLTLVFTWTWSQTLTN